MIRKFGKMNMNVLELIKEYQLNIMLVMSSICALLSFFVLITRSLTAVRKCILMSIELSAMFLLIFDRFAYHYRGDTTDIGYHMVRISNFMVFFLTLAVILFFTMYLMNLYRVEGGVKLLPKRLYLSCALCGIAALMLVVSQFTGFYYTFDSLNQYKRANGFMICYLFPMMILVLDLSVILEYHKKIGKRLLISILLFSIIPVVSSVFQIFLYGISLTNITLVGLAVTLYVFSLRDMNDKLEKASKREIEIVRE